MTNSVTVGSIVDFNQVELGKEGGRYSSKCKIKSGSYLEMWLPLSALDKVASCVEFICTLV